jgi:hypothetical protein
MNNTVLISLICAFLALDNSRICYRFDPWLSTESDSYEETNSTLNLDVIVLHFLENNNVIYKDKSYCCWLRLFKHSTSESFEIMFSSDSRDITKGDQPAGVSANIEDPGLNDLQKTICRQCYSDVYVKMFLEDHLHTKYPQSTIAYETIYAYEEYAALTYYDEEGNKKFATVKSIEGDFFYLVAIDNESTPVFLPIIPATLNNQYVINFDDLIIFSESISITLPLPDLKVIVSVLD